MVAGSCPPALICFYVLVSNGSESIDVIVSPTHDAGNWPAQSHVLYTSNELGPLLGFCHFPPLLKHYRN